MCSYDSMSNNVSTISSLLGELDQAIAASIEIRGLTAEIDEDYSEVSSAVLELREELQGHLRVHGDGPIQALNAVHITSPLLAWIPKRIPDAFSVTSSVSASEALAKAFREPSQTNIPS